MTKELTKFLQEKQTSGQWLEIANKFGVQGTNKQKSDYVRRLWKKYRKSVLTTTAPGKKVITSEELNRLTQEYKIRAKIEVDPKNTNNVLVIGDIHEPFSKEGYLEFCKEQQIRFNCGTIVFIGDIIDSHFSSFHHVDPDGLSANLELDQAVLKLSKWYEAFPNATITLGNHDRIIARKLFSVGVSQRWMRPLGEVLNTPNWKFVESYKFNNVLYIHGEGSTAIKKAQQEFCSVVQGHLHTEGYVQFLNGGKNFGMQVGCGIDFDSYAFAYAQRGKQPVISCGVVLNQSPILIPFI